MRPLIKESILYALLWIAVSVAIYLIDFSLTQAPGFGLITFVLFSSGMVWLGIRERERRGGFISYWPAWKVLLIISSIYVVFGVVWQLLLFQVIDPDLKGEMMKMAEDKAFNDMKDQGISDAQIEQSMDFAMGFVEFFFKPVGMIVTAVLGIIIYMIINFLLALIVRREPAPGSALDADL